MNDQIDKETLKKIFDSPSLNYHEKFKLIINTALDGLSSCDGKKSLIVWSGGMDSTSLVFKAILENKPFETIYFYPLCNKEKAANELFARNRIKDLFEKEYGVTWKDHVISIENGLTTYFSDVTFGQAAAWLYGLLMNGIDVEKYKEVEFGYVLRDEFWVDQIMYEDMFKATAKVKLRGKIPPPLVYPYKYTFKEEVPNEFIKKDDKILETYAKILELIWTCEPVSKSRNWQCGKCYSCRKLEEAKAKVAKEIATRKVLKEEPFLPGFDYICECISGKLCV